MKRETSIRLLETVGMTFPAGRPGPRPAWTAARAKALTPDELEPCLASYSGCGADNRPEIAVDLPSSVGAVRAAAAPSESGLEVLEVGTGPAPGVVRLAAIGYSTGSPGSPTRPRRGTRRCGASRRPIPASPSNARWAPIRPRRSTTCSPRS